MAVKVVVTGGTGFLGAALVDTLLARGADPSLRDTQYNGTPSDWARVNKHPAIAVGIEGGNR